MEGLEYPPIQPRLLEGEKVAAPIIEASNDYDLVVIGAPEEPLFKNLLVGNVTEEVVNHVAATAIVVKRRSSRLHSVLRQTVLMPTTGQEIKVSKGDEEG
jgi:hypothetical protein